MTLAEIAAQIFSTEFESDTEITTEEKILAYITANLGRLNTLIEEALTEPDLTQEHAAIFDEMYLVKYYGTEARKSSAGYGQDFTRIKEGDTEYFAVNKTEISKNYRTLASDAQTRLNTLVNKYKANKAKPLGILTADALN